MKLGIVGYKGFSAYALLVWLIVEIKHQYQDCMSHIGAYLLYGLVYKAKHEFVK